MSPSGRIAGLRLKLALAARQRLRVRHGAQEYQLECGSASELWRAKTMLTKEAGTLAWIERVVKEGQVFCDVGANVGIYSLVAARRVGPTGVVYAFEPHLPTAACLVRNVCANALAERVRVLSCALDDRPGFLDFNYASLESGSALSQLDGTRDDTGSSFQPAFSELKYATSLDELTDRGVIRRPHHIKIDVDGNEPRVLGGMAQLARGSDRPLSIQVEVCRRNRLEVERLMADLGYSLVERHFTADGSEKLRLGEDPLDIAHNCVYQAA